jgi:hypothetical protein
VTNVKSWWQIELGLCWEALSSQIALWGHRNEIEPRFNQCLNQLASLTIFSVCFCTPIKIHIKYEVLLHICFYCNIEKNKDG